MVSDPHVWLKGLHVAAAILFVGGVLAETAFLAAQRQVPQSTSSRDAIAAFRAWDRLLTTPAMLLVWTFGLTLAVSAGWFHSGWLQAKLVFVLVLSALRQKPSPAGGRGLGEGGRSANSEF